MKIETELDAGGAGYFLIDNKVELLNILECRVTQTVHYAGGSPGEPTVEYLTTRISRHSRSTDREGAGWVPQSRGAKTKAELLAKL